MQPFVVGELACGVMPRRAETLALPQHLPLASIASHAEVLGFIERHSLAGRGGGCVDLHLVASALMSPPTRLWTRDRRLAAVAAELSIAFDG